VTRSFTNWSEADLHLLQRGARDKKKATGKKLGHCYEQLSQELGFNTYAALRAAMREGRVKDTPFQTYDEFLVAIKETK
jgi:hypothetical protein